MYSVYVPDLLRILEKNWIRSVKRDPRFALVKGREYFTGPWEEAVKLLDGSLAGLRPCTPPAPSAFSA